MLRIIGGIHRTRHLLTPPDASVSRPFAHRAREGLFNMLREWFEDASVLDLFAGVGTMGLEAVSRGASRVVMVERDRGIATLLEKNIEALGCGDFATGVRADALGELALMRAPTPVDIVFMDPPYPLMGDEPGRLRVFAQAARCRRVMADESFLVLRSPLGPDDLDLSVEGFDGPEAHQFGATMWVLLYAPLRR
ncbi:MAG: 16S rRNA (guanine(966)-N(2))-methyltransferase RsmD [Planctomycetes bacterium]|nr:16S rRNA (guanine(966)-N(2))-methyltransferase RsmD [Planctomycetota bacterium]